MMLVVRVVTVWQWETSLSSLAGHLHREGGPQAEEGEHEAAGHQHLQLHERAEIGVSQHRHGSMMDTSHCTAGVYVRVNKKYQFWLQMIW